MNPPRAVITWIGPQNGSTNANAFGTYGAAGLPVGQYTITASAQKCTPSAVNVTILAGQTMVQNFKLQCN